MVRTKPVLDQANLVIGWLISFLVGNLGMLLYLLDATCCRGGVRYANSLIYGSSLFAIPHGAWLFLAMCVTALFSDPIANILRTPATVASLLTHLGPSALRG